MFPKIYSFTNHKYLIHICIREKERETETETERQRQRQRDRRLGERAKERQTDRDVLQTQRLVEIFRFSITQYCTHKQYCLFFYGGSGGFLFFSFFRCVFFFFSFFFFFFCKRDNLCLSREKFFKIQGK